MFKEVYSYMQDEYILNMQKSWAFPDMGLAEKTQLEVVDVVTAKSL